jgi:hypothetical protein
MHHHHHHHHHNNGNRSQGAIAGTLATDLAVGAFVVGAAAVTAAVVSGGMAALLLSIFCFFFLLVFLPFSAVPVSARFVVFVRSVPLIHLHCSGNHHHHHRHHGGWRFVLLVLVSCPATFCIFSLMLVSCFGPGFYVLSLLLYVLSFLHFFRTDLRFQVTIIMAITITIMVTTEPAFSAWSRPRPSCLPRCCIFMHYISGYFNKSLSVNRCQNSYTVREKERKKGGYSSSRNILALPSELPSEILSVRRVGIEPTAKRSTVEVAASLKRSSRK